MSIKRRLLNSGGRGSFSMEAWKFSIYLMVPILASVYFDSPENLRKSADYWKFVTYPSNPNTGLKEQIVKSQQQEAQRIAYREQLAQLQQVNAAPKAKVEKMYGWWRVDQWWKSGEKQG